MQLLTVTELDGTSCLRFIDPYGDTLFNQLQLPALRRELESLRPHISAAVKTAWSTEELHSHLEQLLALIDEGLARGAHHFVRFLGD
jgi:hypothetical protein